MVRYRQSEISTQNYDLITQTIPNRLAYFDSLNLSLFPFEGTLGVDKTNGIPFKIYPNPFEDYIELSGINFKADEIKIYNILRQNVTHLTSFEKTTLNTSNLPIGLYILKTKLFLRKLVKQ